MEIFITTFWDVFRFAVAGMCGVVALWAFAGLTVFVIEDIATWIRRRR